ncbi:hypothetical protein [Polynucleobacter yangtzensis]|uniref:hypothetical protein n=1 Tax=Polynucleobacter yangtzensis TaxID=1743159 RepID=UPI000833BB49|nr:hypothetical protein [Polynucleobacter yangtzensis]
MQTLVDTQSSPTNQRLLSRLGLALILISSVLLGIWAVKDTIALRNILLVSGTIVSIIFLYQYLKSVSVRAIGTYWLPVICIFISLIWVVLHYCYFSIQPEVQLKELQSIWLRSALASVLGIATGIALISRPRYIGLFWTAILISFFVLFAQYLPLAIKSGNLVVPLDYLDFRRYLFIGKINPMYLGVLLIAGSTGLLLDAIRTNDRLWLKRIAIFWLLCLLTAMYSFAFIVNTRSGILLGSLIIIAWSFLGLLTLFGKKGGKDALKSSGAKKFIYVLVFALGVVGIFGYKQIQRDSGWHQIIEDIEIGYQVEKYPHWQNVDTYGFPKTESGKVVTYNTYERVAWATAGIKSVPYHPYGVGVLILPLGLAAKDLFPGVSPLSTHSGWVDLTLAFGLPFIALMWVANLSIVYLAVRQKSPLKYTILTLSIILFALFLVGELSNGHNLEMLFYFFALMSGLLIAQAAKLNSLTPSAPIENQ